MFGILLLSVCALGVVCVSWAYLVEPNLLFVRDVEASLPGWKGAGKEMNVVIAGDLHLSSSPIDEVRLQRYVQKINSLNPDLIILVGDYTKAARKNIGIKPELAAQHLKNLHARYGVIAVPGNHDFYDGWNRWKKALISAGIRVPENKHELITLEDGRQLQITGLKYYHKYRKNHRPKRISADIPHLVVSHVPDIDAALQPGDADFIISGHTHGGQIRLPFNIDWFRPNSDNPWTRSYPWHTSNGNRYLITKGLGTSRLPLRFCCPPEIFLLKLK